MIDQRVWQINERGRKEVNFLAAFLKFFGGEGLRGFVQQGVIEYIRQKLHIMLHKKVYTK